MLLPHLGLMLSSGVIDSVECETRCSFVVPSADVQSLQVAFAPSSARLTSVVAIVHVPLAVCLHSGLRVNCLVCGVAKDLFGVGAAVGTECCSAPFGTFFIRRR